MQPLLRCLCVWVTVGMHYVRHTNLAFSNNILLSAHSGCCGCGGVMFRFDHGQLAVSGDTTGQNTVYAPHTACDRHVVEQQLGFAPLGSLMHHWPWLMKVFTRTSSRWHHAMEWCVVADMSPVRWWWRWCGVQLPSVSLQITDGGDAVCIMWLAS